MTVPAMKIVFLAPFGIRPKGTVIARMLPLAAALQDLGHTVVIIAPPYTNPEDSGKVEVVGGVTLCNIELGPGNKALVAPVLAWRMFRAALAEKPDLIHLFKPKGYGGLASMLLLSLKRCGVCMPSLFVDTDDWEGRGGMNDLHAYSSAEKRLFAFQEKWLSRHAAGVTVASLELQRLTAGLGVASERVLYLPNCVEDIPSGEGSRIRHTLGIAPEVPVVLLYTRFFEFSQERLYRILAGIYRSVPEVCFLVVGKGSRGEEERLLDAARSLGFENALLMVGWLEPCEIPDYLSAPDVAIYPLDDTLMNRAKCPAKLTEIIRAGVPVVADNVGQAAEYTAPGVSDVLCDPGNWNEMADCAARLLRDRNAARTLGETGRGYLLKTFSWKTYAARLCDLYQTASGLHG